LEDERNPQLEHLEDEGKPESMDAEDRVWKRGIPQQSRILPRSKIQKRKVEEKHFQISLPRMSGGNREI
jgi:hypothetical protein